MSANKTMPMRLDQKVRIAINILVGEYQTKTGKSFSVSAGIWQFIVDNRPDVAKRAEAQAAALPPEEPATKKKPKTSDK